MTTRIIVWFRGKDLRISDHAPLRDAQSAGDVIPLFVLDRDAFAPNRARERPHGTQFLLDSLRALEGALAGRGSRLVVVAGDSVAVVPRLAREWKTLGRSPGVCWGVGGGGGTGGWGGPWGGGRGFRRGGGGCPREPGEGGREPFTGFSAVSRAVFGPRRCWQSPGRRGGFCSVARGFAHGGGARRTGERLVFGGNPGIRGEERRGRGRVPRFLRRAAAAYPEQRDRMDLAGTSRLSADLRFGTISPRQVWSAVDGALDETAAARCFLGELVRRELSEITPW